MTPDRRSGRDRRAGSDRRRSRGNLRNQFDRRVGDRRQTAEQANLWRWISLRR